MSTSRLKTLKIGVDAWFEMASNFEDIELQDRENVMVFNPRTGDMWIHKVDEDGGCIHEGLYVVTSGFIPAYRSGEYIGFGDVIKGKKNFKVTSPPHSDPRRAKAKPEKDLCHAKVKVTGVATNWKISGDIR